MDPRPFTARQQLLPFNRQGAVFRAVARSIPCRADDCDGQAYPHAENGNAGYRCAKCHARQNPYGEKDEC